MIPIEYSIAIGVIGSWIAGFLMGYYKILPFWYPQED